MAAAVMIAILAFAGAGFWLGRRRAYAVAGDTTAALHSQPNYHGMYVGLWAAAPALFIALVWSVADGFVARGLTRTSLPEAAAARLATAPEDALLARGALMTRMLEEAVRVDRLAQEDADAVAPLPASLRPIIDGDASPSAMVARIQVADDPAAVIDTLFALLDTVNPIATRQFWRDVGTMARGDADSAPASASDPLRQIAAERFRSVKGVGGWALIAAGFAAAGAGLAYARRRLSAAFRARNAVERVVMGLLVLCSTIAILTTAGIVLSLLFEALRFFVKVPVWEFLFGTHWSPQTALRAGQAGQTGSFGAVPLFVGTLLITVIAMIIAVPTGLFSAIFLSEYASRRLRGFMKPALEVLAGVPTVVYGFFALLTVGPWIRDRVADLSTVIGTPIDASTQSALSAGLVMGVMIIPFVSSLSDDVISSVPQSLRDGSYGMGATHSETVLNVVMPAALPGIVGAVLLAVSRAIGETMIVVMAAGLHANLTANPLDAVTTVTVQIVALLTGDTEFDSTKTLSAFALGLTLFVVTLGLNVIALRVVQTYREKYD